MNIRLHIGEIVLDGIDLQESQLFDMRLALERHLAGRFGSSMRDQFTSVEQDSFIIEAGLSSSPDHLAAQLASTIHQASLPPRPVAADKPPSAIPPSPAPTPMSQTSVPPRPAPGRGGQGVRGQILSGPTSTTSSPSRSSPATSGQPGGRP